MSGIELVSKTFGVLLVAATVVTVLAGASQGFEGAIQLFESLHTLSKASIMAGAVLVSAFLASCLS